MIDGCLAYIASAREDRRGELQRNLLTVLQRATRPEHGAKVIGQVEACILHCNFQERTFVRSTLQRTCRGNCRREALPSGQGSGLKSRCPSRHLAILASMVLAPVPTPTSIDSGAALFLGQLSPVGELHAYLGLIRAIDDTDRESAVELLHEAGDYLHAQAQRSCRVEALRQANALVGHR